MDNEEIEIGLRCVGAPIRDYTGSAYGSVLLAWPLPRRVSPRREYRKSITVRIVR